MLNYSKEALHIVLKKHIHAQTLKTKSFYYGLR